jgi:hypothetical protein
MGFTNQDDAVIEQYMYEHWPRAVRKKKHDETESAARARPLATSTRSNQTRPTTTNPPTNPKRPKISLHGAYPSFVFTTHAYLLSLFFDCDPASPLALRCPTADQKDALATAIAQGAITWHAAPFNPQYEMFDAPLLRYAIEGVARRLDRRFGLANKKVVSLRDVPGLTRAALPALAQSGVVAISAGVNGFSAPPGVPKNTPFLWRDERSGAEVLYFVHPGGYGGLKRQDGCVTHAKSRLALCSWWNGDNGGPPQNASEVAQILQGVEEEFPEATEVKASTLEAYVSGLWEEAAGWEEEQGGAGASASSSASSSSSSWPGRQFFPVVTAEVGDTWIHGVGSDVTRVADYRAALRARRAYCGGGGGGGGGGGPPAPGCSGADDPSSASDPDARAVDEFSRMLTKVPEHTWGVAFGPYFGDFTNYTNAWLQAGIGWEGGDGGDEGSDNGSRSEAPPPPAQPFKPDAELAPNYAAVVRSWRRQYGYLEAARRALLIPSPTTTTTTTLAAAADAAPAKPHPILEAWDADVAEREAMAADEAFARTASAAIRQEEAAVAVGPLDEAADGRWRPIFVRGRRNDDDDPEDDCAPFPIRFVHWSFAFDRCTGGLTSLRRRRFLDAQGAELPPGTEWAGGAAAGDGGDDQQRPPHFAELRYDVYGEEDYEAVWRDYAYVTPPWVGDFGKWNLSAALDPEKQQRRVGALPRLAASFFRRDPPASGGGSRVRLVLRFDDELVREAGAPREAWLDVREPGDGGGEGGRGGGGEGGSKGVGGDNRRKRPLLVTAVWRRKTPTRRPEALWLRFAPGSAAAASVDHSSWRLSKVGGGAGGGTSAGGDDADSVFSVSPFDVAVNGSNAMHAVSDAGVAVWSTLPEREVLRIGTLDAALVAAGAPLPFPLPRRQGEPPDLAGEGVSFNLVNNVWGTNWPMWSPWRAREVDAAFRFVLTATTREEEEEEEEEERGAAAAAAARRVEQV